ncbi:hypothetical protein CC1G_07501 [Coprinopsis cinerea okayama7|uniref:CFEM domain-containing protein n=1 Tax=Coprinopsis cinerea (strain Okayama-7 / 130 / ATCC MYA-4618 / FGSC 9003) TaxID=240176 RepID=A8P127_COPC7|nr:hypothetical protein CC1G_07501 [Coprinopsis cinerea okayama7\|eukprot:XP_001838011.1 hypothetical protein CC1G_07501 [Coprinopsis cinerea okayama7\
MRLSTVTLTVLAAVASVSASALYRRQYPSCANACLAAADFGNCEMTDNFCLCSSEPFVSSTTTCIQAACEGEDLETALFVSRELCERVGVTLGGPTPTGDAATPSGSGSGSGSSSPAPTSDGDEENEVGEDGSAMAHGVNIAAVAALGLAALAF